MTGKNRIMIYGPKGDGSYVVEFRTAKGQTQRASRKHRANTVPPSSVNRVFIFGSARVL
jgi:hypothetical protein